LMRIEFGSATTTISDDQDTIPVATKIIGYDPSTAKDYAVKYNRTFEKINLQSIDITTPANKLSYAVGEILDITGLVITGIYSNGSTKVETITTSNISGFDSTAPATDQILTIKVGDKTTTYKIQILAEDYTYTITESGKAEITGYTGSGGDITIPSTLGGYPVIIGDSAFACCQTLTSVHISEGVTSIGNAAFSDCYYLTNINIPDSVTNIGFEAFMLCIELTSITIPQGVTSIDYSLFAACLNMTSITFKSETTTIYDDAFTIPETTKIIGYETSTAKDYATKYNRTFIVIGTTYLQSIAITTPATKLIYTVGDALDIDGLEVTGYYSDGTQKVETITNENITGFNSSVATTNQIIAITKGGNTVTYNVQIVNGTDATLSAIQYNGSNLTSFSPATESYTVVLPYGTTSIPNVTAIATETNANIAITQAIALPGTTTILITAEDGVTSKTYTVSFYPIANNKVATGHDHSLLMNPDGTVMAWGDGRFGQVVVPEDLTDVVKVAAGSYHSLALKSDGTIVSWGGIDPAEKAPAGLTNIIDIDAFSYRSVAVKTDGSVVGWGPELDRIFGNGISLLTDVKKAVLGSYFCLALKSDGTVVALGDNGFGQTNIPANLSNIIDIDAGEGHALALKADGTVVAWGYNYWGQATVPAGLDNVVGIVASWDYSLAIKADGTIVAWGNGLSQSTGAQNVPVGLTNVVGLASSMDHTLALKSDNTTVTWGDSNNPAFKMSPIAAYVNVTGLAEVGQILTGSYYYVDPDKDLEGNSTFKWYRGEPWNMMEMTEIIGSNDLTYVLTDEDFGKYVFFEVTPVAATGAELIGLPTLSIEGIGPIKTAIPVTGVSLNNITLTMGKGQTATLTATISPVDAINQNMIWCSDHPGCADVVNGVVTAYGKGTAVITVTTVEGGFTGTCTVTVTIPVSGVSLSKTSLNMVAGGATATLIPVISPADADYKSVTWSSVDPAVATVDANGVVTPMAAGTTAVTATTDDGGFVVSCTVTVGTTNVAVTGVILNHTDYTLNVGDSDLVLVPSITPANANNTNVIWSTDAPGIAIVNNGTVTAVASGTANITVITADGGFTDTCAIKVVAGSVAVTGVTLNQNSLSFVVGGAPATLVATIIPENATNKNVVFTTDHPSVATVSASGIVTPVGAGTATITVTTVDRFFEDICEVTVVAGSVAVTGVTLDQNALNLTVGGTPATLVATIVPENATNKNVIFTSNRLGIATVSASGIVTPVGAGTATITITTVDGNKTATCTVIVAAANNQISFDINTIPNNTLKLGDDFFDMSSDAMNDPQATIAIASLLKDGINKNIAYFKFGGKWYAPFELTEQEFLNPAYALTDAQVTAIKGFNKWYKAGGEIVDLRPGTYTITPINQFSSGFAITANNVPGAAYFNIYKKSNDTLVNSAPTAIGNSLNSMPAVFSIISDLEVWIYSDAAGIDKIVELKLEGTSDAGILDLK
jgi:uncharacterized protein YjdB/alpha-tubulin suppressor-like RCC1 family protein